MLMKNFYDFNILYFKNENLKNNFIKNGLNVCEIISYYYNKEKINYLNLDKIINSRYIIKLDKFYGPFEWDDEFSFEKSINFDDSYLEKDKCKYFLNLLVNPKRIFIFLIYYDNVNFYIVFKDNINGLNLKVYPLSVDKFNYIISKKVDWNQKLNKEEYNFSENYSFIEEEVDKLFYKLTEIDLNKHYNIHILLKLNNLSSMIPWELLQKKYHKNKITFSFNYLDESTNKILERDDLNNLKEFYNKKISYFYFSPETKSSSLEKEEALKNNIDKIVFIENEDQFLNNLNNNLITIISSHGFLKGGVNTLILNSKPINIDIIETLNKIPFFIIFLSCLLTIAAYKKNNILASLISKGLNESIFSSFIIKDNIAFNFFKNFISDIAYYNDPFLNYLYIFDNRFEEGFQFFKYFNFYNENNFLKLFDRGKYLIY